MISHLFFAGLFGFEGRFLEQCIQPKSNAASVTAAASASVDEITVAVTTVNFLVLQSQLAVWVLSAVIIRGYL